MKRISLWARKNVSTARLLIVFLRLLLIGLAILTGRNLANIGAYLPSNDIYFWTFVLLSVTVIAYPAKTKSARSKPGSYIRQKTCDFILPLCSFAVIATAVNAFEMPVFVSHVYGTGIIQKPTPQEILASGKTRKMMSRAEKRILKKEFNRQVKRFAVAKITGDEETAGKAWKIALTIIAAVGLTFLLASLACTLSCNGSDAAAVVVMVFGVGAVVLAMILILKRIHRGPKKIPDPNPPPRSPDPITPKQE
jgi:hypothetical protein